MVFRDGIPGWEKAGYSLNTATKKKNTEITLLSPEQLNSEIAKSLIIDIRSASLYNSGYILESRAMPLPYLSMLSVELPKNGKIIVVDQRGEQSRKAVQWLLDNGFEDVSMLKNGLTGYANAGFPLEK